MPTYEYECLSCGYSFERFQSMKDSPIKTCPKCKKKVRRLIGRGSGIIFKGTGFYATDYRKTKPSQDSKEKVSSQDKKADNKKSNKSTNTQNPGSSKENV